MFGSGVEPLWPDFQSSASPTKLTKREGVRYKRKGMYLAIVGLPWISCIVGGVLGRKCGRKGVSYISSISIVISAILAIMGGVEVILRESPVSVRVMR